MRLFAMVVNLEIYSIRCTVSVVANFYGDKRVNLLVILCYKFALKNLTNIKQMILQMIQYK